MSGFGTTFQEMEAGANHIDDVNAQIQGYLSSLRGQLAPLPSAWRGAASTAFVNLMARYDENARKIQEALTAIATQVRGANATYVAEEDTHSSTMSQITGALG
jgi:WXG100 family type VII secretion target